MRKLIIISVLVVLFFFSCERGSGTGSSQDATDANKETNQETTIDYTSVPDNVEYVFIAATNTGIDNYNFKGLMLLKNFLENNSNGKIGLKIYPNGQLASNVDDNFRGLSDGTIDIVQSTGDAARYWAPIAVFDLPYMFVDDRIAEAVVMDHNFVTALRKGAMAKNPYLRLMMISNSGGWRNFATVKKQIKTPDDVKGVKLRTVPSKTQQELVKLLGGIPTSIAWPEVYTSLSTGVVDGTKNGVVDIMAVKFDDILKYITLDGHAYMSGFWWVGQKKYESLPDDMKKIVNDGFSAMQQYLFAYPKYQSIEAFSQFKRKGLTVYKPTVSELKEFQERTAPLQDWFVEEYAKDDQETKDILKLFKDTIKKQSALLESLRKSELR